MSGIDKAFVKLGGETLIGRAIRRARPQVGDLLLSANGDPSRFAPYGVPVIADRTEGFLGPLAGILSGLEWMHEHRPEAKWLVTFACDTPFFPTDLVARLIDGASAAQAQVAIATSGGRRHNIFGVWSRTIAETSASVLGKQGLRKMDDFIDPLPHTSVDFPTAPFDPFFNINTPDDLARAEALMAAKNAIR